LEGLSRRIFWVGGVAMNAVGRDPLGQSSIPRWRTHDVFDLKVTHVVDGHGCVRGRQTLGQVE
jgi:hypothetical protein